MKKFGLGDHKFDPNITAHLSQKGSSICKDFTFINYLGGALYSFSEDRQHANGTFEVGINGRVEGELNNEIERFNSKATRGKEDEFDILTESVEAFRELLNENV